MTDNLLGMPQTLLAPDPAAAELAGSEDGALAAAVLTRAASTHPTSSLAWALLAEAALDGDRPVEAYAYARTGYHRGLDALRKAGWRGQGPVPWSHQPNRGFLRALAALTRAARAIGERDEEARCAAFLRESSREAADVLQV
ncbi:DUF3151 domain-containing protein [Lapillicoccus sp.]|uniref:DUF3151 domain-containing protein n=1 Tax=Lapillicoccus sp. TaxID=1909287 RepID=UPI003983D890